MGSAVVRLPESGGWNVALEAPSAFSPDFMSDREQPPIQERVDLE